VRDDAGQPDRSREVLIEVDRVAVAGGLCVPGDLLLR